MSNWKKLADEAITWLPFNMSVEILYKQEINEKVAENGSKLYEFASTTGTVYTVYKRQMIQIAQILSREKKDTAIVKKKQGEFTVIVKADY